jgi:hypothetical protein
MKAFADAIERIPLTSIIHLIATCVLGADLVTDGRLSDDALTYFAIVTGGNGLVGLARAHATRKPQLVKVESTTVEEEAPRSRVRR